MLRPVDSYRAFDRTALRIGAPFLVLRYMNAGLARAANDYRLVSICEARAPAGANGPEWHRYEIIQGANTIVGYREGSIESVTTAVEEIVLQLNERRLDRRGRVHIKLKSGSASGSNKS